MTTVIGGTALILLIAFFFAGCFSRWSGCERARICMIGCLGDCL
jgi:hypothetical protein